MSKSIYEKIREELKNMKNKILGKELTDIHQLIIELDGKFCSNNEMEEWYKSGQLQAKFEKYILKHVLKK
jgi:hypothetical protein